MVFHGITSHWAAHDIFLLVCSKDSFPERLLLNPFHILMHVHFRWSTSESLQWLCLKSCHYVSIPTICLSPCFLKERNPYLSTYVFGKGDPVGSLFNRDMIIDRDLLELSINTELKLIQALEIKFLCNENLLYSFSILCQCCNCTQEIAISKLPLLDIIPGDPIKKNWSCVLCCKDISDPHPFSLLEHSDLIRK